jgi:hypothetical protein
VSLPPWPGADAVYTYLTRWLEAHASQRYAAWRAAPQRKRGPRPEPTDEQRAIIAALDRGDEETLKAYALRLRTEAFLTK